jgi:hypothetical protein
VITQAFHHFWGIIVLNFYAPVTRQSSVGANAKQRSPGNPAKRAPFWMSFASDAQFLDFFSITILQPTFSNGKDRPVTRYHRPAAK